MRNVPRARTGSGVACATNRLTARLPTVRCSCKICWGDAERPSAGNCSDRAFCDVWCGERDADCLRLVFGIDCFEYVQFTIGTLGGRFARKVLVTMSISSSDRV